MNIINRFFQAEFQVNSKNHLRKKSRNNFSRPRFLSLSHPTPFFHLLTPIYIRTPKSLTISAILIPRHHQHPLRKKTPTLRRQTARATRARAGINPFSNKTYVTQAREGSEKKGAPEDGTRHERGGQRGTGLGGARMCVS